MNNWEIRKFLRMILAIQLAMLGLVGMAALGFDIPVLRQLVGFIYLTFIPGLLILRLLRLHRLGTIETLLYSVGLSIALVMFLGFFVNMLYPLVGIAQPISTIPLVITLAIAVAILCVIAYIREGRETMAYSGHHSVPWSEIFSPPALFLFLLPLLAILGIYLVNFHQNNTLLLIVIALIALVAVLVAFNKFIPQRLYPLAVITIAIALLYHQSLISTYLTGTGDYHYEYYLSELVRGREYWDVTYPSTINAMLSIVILAPTYSLVLNMDTVWMFKIVYPLFFSLVPLVLFQVFRKQTDDRIAFLAAFFFMSFFAFFTGMLELVRQQIAELFFALSILLFLDKGMATTKRAALLIIFGFSIVVSHHGLSYFYMFYLLMALLLLLLWRGSAKELWERVAVRFSKSRPVHADPERSEGEESRPFAIAQGDKINNPPRATPSISALSTTHVMLFVVFGFAWYMYTASGSPFTSIVYIGNHLYDSLSDFFIFGTRGSAILLGLGLASPEVASVQRNIYLVIQYITQLFIVVGVIGLLFNLRKTRFQPVYIAMTLVSALLLAMSIILPYFTGFFGMFRIYHITLLLLAPFCILGGLTVFSGILRPFRFASRHVASSSLHTKLFLLVLIPYFLFATGFIYQVSGDIPSSIALRPDKFLHLITHEQDVAATKWLTSMQDSTFVYSDYYAYHLLVFGGFFPKDQVKWLEPSFDDEGEIGLDETKVDNEGVIYLSYGNVVQNSIWVFSQTWRGRIYAPVALETTGFPLYRNKIYDNGAIIYK